MEVGENLNEVIDRHKVRVGIVNLTQAKPVGLPQILDTLVAPANNVPLLAELKVPIPGAGTPTRRSATSCRRSPPTRSPPA